jgi:hypothetical protein
VEVDAGRDLYPPSFSPTRALITFGCGIVHAWVEYGSHEYVQQISQQ